MLLPPIADPQVQRSPTKVGGGAWGAGFRVEPSEDREGCGQRKRVERTLQVGERPSHFWGALSRVWGTGLGQGPGLPARSLRWGLCSPTVLRGQLKGICMTIAF